jgi:glutamine amidotransferase
MIAIINYGVGNIRAFANIYSKLDIPIKIAEKASDLDNVDKLILPGVGAFDHAMDKLNASGMRERVDELVLEKKLPVIGICVGMQMLAKSSDEGSRPGLGWIDADVKKFDVNKIQFKTHLPHMGWNDIYATSNNPLLNELQENAKFYFLHSYYFHCNNEADVIASANYGINFTCAANHDNIYGVQFHPEKSHQYGIQLLNNFANL